MNNNEKQSLLKKKSAAVATVICFVAVIAMVGAYTFRNYQNKLEKQMAEAQEKTESLTKESTERTAANDIVLPEHKTDTSDTEENGETESGEDVQLPVQGESAESTAAVPEVWFGEESLLEWPASGAVLINYSMDQTVYFSTLEQYKYNPALIIGGQVGENIEASASGVVTSIEQDAQTGLTVTLDMGNGYSAIYGQLKEVPVQMGDYVEQGQIIGYLSEPTKYYSVEGPNLYFKITKDGEPVNPMDFMEG